MNPEGLLEGFIATIVAGVMLIFLIRIIDPNIGETLAGIFPDIINIAAYIFITLFVVALVYQILE